MKKKNKFRFREPEILDKIASPLFGKQDFASFFRWINLMRALTVFAVFFAIGALKLVGKLHFNPRSIFFVLICYSLLAIIFWYVSRRVKRSFAFLYSQIAFDVLAITVGIYFAGGINSDFAPLYVLTIITSAFLSLRALLGTTILVAICYGGLIVLNYYGLVSPLQGLEFGSDTSRMLVFVLIFAVIAFQSRYYASRVKKKDRDLMKLKDEFLFTTVHDLRSPSTAIQWTLEKYSKPEFVKKNKAIAEDVSMVRGLISDVLNLVNKLMNMASSENASKRKPCEPLDIVSIMLKSLRGQEAFLQKKQIKTIYNPPANLPKVFANEDNLKEIFANLLTNAVKYNKQGGSIKIEHKVLGKFLETDIEDTGIGIAPENMHKLFSPYFRDKAVKNVQGTGLGLYIVKKLVQRTGGKIKVASVPNKGTIFKVLLPIVCKKSA